MRPIAVRSDDEWNFDPEPEDVLRAGDVLFMQGPPEGVAEVREMAGATTAVHTTHAEPAGELTERSEEHTSELQSRQYLVCRLLLENKHTQCKSTLLQPPL